MRFTYAGASAPQPKSQPFTFGAVLRWLTTEVADHVRQGCTLHTEFTNGTLERTPAPRLSCAHDKVVKATFSLSLHEHILLCIESCKCLNLTFRL